MSLTARNDQSNYRDEWRGLSPKFLMDSVLRADIYLRYRALSLSDEKLPVRSTRRVSCLLSCLDPCDLTRSSFGLAKMSSQTMENMKKNIEWSKELPVQSSYEMAMEALSSLISGQKRGDKPFVKGKYGKLDRMSMYLEILGLEEKVADLKIIHVAGTKGKGSTCTFCESILRECGFRTGLFISPHLIDVRERFRLDGLDISEEKFLLHFWDCWNQLKEKVTSDLPMPPLFQFLTVLAFKIFTCEEVDVAIIEVGLGGKRDSTNVIKKPVVCGIASLGMDHTEILGDTLGKIASHKAGIFKPQIPAFTVPQLPEAMDVLQEKAHDLEVPLEVVPPLDHEKLKGWKLSLSGDHQLINAGLAVSLCKCWLQSTGNWEKVFVNANQEDDLVEPFLRGLSTAHISGRAQIVCDTPLKSYNLSEVTESSFGDLFFYLDGAHSPESMDVCARWFSNTVKGSWNSSSSSSVKVGNMVNGYVHHKENTEGSNKIPKQILLFNCMEMRDPHILLSQLVRTCASSGTHFSKALFVPNISTYNKVTYGDFVPLDLSARDLSWQFNLQRIWEKIIHNNDVMADRSHKMDSPEILAPFEFLYEDSSSSNLANKCLSSSAVLPSLPLTIRWLRNCVKENPSLRLQVLVTGSLHLVGDVLKLLRK